MTDSNGFFPFVNGEIRCPSCHRKRPMEDLVGEYDAADDRFTVKGIRCSALGCVFHYPDSMVGLVSWGSQIPKPVQVPSYIDNPKCPFCGTVVVKVPDGPFRSPLTKNVEYVRCLHSPLLYRMAVKNGPE